MSFQRLSIKRFRFCVTGLRPHNQSQIVRDASSLRVVCPQSCFTERHRFPVEELGLFVSALVIALLGRLDELMHFLGQFVGCRLYSPRFLLVVLSMSAFGNRIIGVDRQRLSACHYRKQQNAYDSLLKTGRLPDDSRSSPMCDAWS